MFNSTPVSLPSACRRSRKCATCYSEKRFSGCVAEVVELVQSSQILSVSCHSPPTRGTVCDSLFDNVLIMDIITEQLA